MKKPTFPQTFKTCVITSLLALALVGCDDDDDTGEGYIKLYNASPDAPYVYLTVDEDLSSDSDDDDDHYELTYSGVSYGKAHSNITLDEDNYEFQLAWQDDEDSTDVDDLALIEEGDISIKDEYIHLVVLSNSILSPDVTIYDIPEIDDDDDADDDLFNLRVLNVSSTQETVDLYYSADDESFNEAEFITSVSYLELTENQKVDQEDYIFYITAAGSDEVLYTSEDIPFNYASQNIMIVRDNQGTGVSPYVLDKMSDSSVIEYVDTTSEAQFNIYNAVSSDSYNDIQTDIPLDFTYEDDAAFYLNDELIISSLPYGERSEAIVLESGDFSLDITSVDGSETFLSNHLFSITENTNKTVFIYSEYEEVDDDNDGDTDEIGSDGSNGGNGIIDEIEVELQTLVIENSTSASIYSHEVEVVNLIQDDDFASVTVYFLKPNEVIEDSTYSTTVNYKFSNSVSLLNNTYTTKIISADGKILFEDELIVDEDSESQFLILEASNDAAGIKVTLVDQVVEVEEETDSE